MVVADAMGMVAGAVTVATRAAPLMTTRAVAEVGAVAAGVTTAMAATITGGAAATRAQGMSNQPQQHDVQVPAFALVVSLRFNAAAVVPVLQR